MEMSDFDLTVTEVLLVHRNRFVEGFRFNEYQSGRRMDGLVFCVSGQGIFDFEEQKLTLSAGQMLFVPSGSIYSVTCEAADPFIHYTVNFRLSAFDAAAESAICQILSGERCFICADGTDGRLEACFERLLSLWQVKRNGYRVMAKSAVYELLGLYLAGAGRALRDGEGYGKLRAAKHEMDGDFCHDHAIPHLAELCGLSETHFRRLWHRVFGISPTAYLRARRIARAKDLLLSGLYSISEAAREVGFDDANYFSRVFRQETGVSPSEFLKSTD